jgi:hypothetical protein
MPRKSAAKSPFTGLWHIVSMSGWDEDYINEEVQAFIEFDAKRMGRFQFGLVNGGIDTQETQRDGKPAVEWSWEGMAEMDECSGRGWAILDGEELRGMIFIHGGDNSDFVARKPRKQQRPKRK